MEINLLVSGKAPVCLRHQSAGGRLVSETTRYLAVPLLSGYPEYRRLAGVNQPGKNALDQFSLDKIKCGNNRYYNETADDVHTYYR